MRDGLGFKKNDASKVVAFGIPIRKARRRAARAATRGT
jgi:hypothetical protein